MKFAQRLVNASREYRNVFKASDLVKIYVRGLLEVTYERTQQKMQHLLIPERVNIIAISKTTLSEGPAQRPLVNS